MPDPTPAERLTNALIGLVDAAEASRLASTPAKRTEALTAAARQIITALSAWINQGS